MRQKDKIYLGLVVAVAAAIAGGVLTYQRITSSVEQPGQAGEKVFRDYFYGVAISYTQPLREGEPRYEVGEFFAAGDGKELVSLVAPKEAYPETNFYEAFINLSVQSATADNCRLIVREGDSTVTQVIEQNINGRVYQKAQFRSAAAGTFARTDVYHTYFKGNCYEATLNFFQGNIANFDPPIREVNEMDVYEEMEEALETLTIK